MNYYIIAGEASGDIHAAHLVAAIRQRDAKAQFRGIGGDAMAQQGVQLILHYSNLAYMGFIPVLMHLKTILRGMKQCEKDILSYKPDAVILVDYPGFNLRIAAFAHRHTQAKVVYYIAPKIWAWKERRIQSIRRNVDLLLSILPFEVEYYRQRHDYQIHYVGNPTVDEVASYLSRHPEASPPSPQGKAGERPVIALLPGSRRQEVLDNLPRMIQGAAPFAADHQLVIAAAPGLSDQFYRHILEKNKVQCPMPNGQWSMFNGQCSMVNDECSKNVSVQWVRDQTFRLLQHSTAALVTSGTATLETALFGVPQVVCYHTKAGRIVSLLRRLFLRVPHISLVNLICGKEVVPELVAHQMSAANVRRHLAAILPGGNARQAQLEGYRHMAALLGKPGAPDKAASIILEHLKS